MSGIINDNSMGELIEKYFDGATSLDEERLLRSYFRCKNVPDEWKVYQPIFRYFSSEREKRASENKAKTIWMSSLRWVGVAAAACLLLFAGLKFFSTQQGFPEKSYAYINGKKYTDLRLIQSEALKSLNSVSESNDAILSSQIEVLNLFTDN
jgi:hypothetical protein